MLAILPLDDEGSLRPQVHRSSFASVELQDQEILTRIPKRCDPRVLNRRAHPGMPGHRTVNRHARQGATRHLVIRGLQCTPVRPSQERCVEELGPFEWRIDGHRDRQAPAAGSGADTASLQTAATSMPLRLHGERGRMDMRRAFVGTSAPRASWGPRVATEPRSHRSPRAVRGTHRRRRSGGRQSPVRGACWGSLPSGLRAGGCRPRGHRDHR